MHKVGQGISHTIHKVGQDISHTIHKVGQDISHTIHTKTVILTKLNLYKHEDVREILCIVTLYFLRFLNFLTF
jgi:hypothetical protein